ncbi:MAG: tRNA 2-thiouridine(34) synthase MnmA [Proteobacteria bacterium]|nr:tRNA 2-thiouridine(34) synthase MnmA [Pseudomonadota bacterium]
MQPQLPQPGERVIVAMSGGVDSSVAAALLHERGCEVIGITLSLYDAPSDDSFDGGCCTPEDIADARRVCSDLGVPHYVLNYRDDFNRSVIQPFVSAYRAGRTPNPCVLCNNVLKFDRLLHRAGELEARWLATGHYAQAMRDDAGDSHLLKGLDPGKDQSYFLYGITSEALSRLCFPLGGMTKTEARDAARRLGVRTESKPDSQDVCFIPDGRTADFVASHGGAGEGGDIVLEDGTAIGRHDGVHGFTIGQRKGIGVAAPEPLYVSRIDAARRRLVVATADRLDATAIEAADWNWLRRPAPGEPTAARPRYRCKPASVARVHAEGDVVRLELAEPVRAAAPGQALVLYGGADLGEVLGGGTIA